MKRLTRRQAAAYVKDGWAHCPYCKSENIEGGSVDIEGNEAFQEVTCNDCESVWQDVFTLTDALDGPR